MGTRKNHLERQKHIFKIMPVKKIICYDLRYCKSGNFRETFIFANGVKRHICEAENSRLGHDLHISVNDKVISALREDFIFTKLRICEVSRK